MADVFISYATEDRERAKPIVEVIEKAGFSVWWDRRIGLGSSFDREIERELDSAGCVIVIWSAHSVDSDWVRSEAQEGLDRGVLVPLLIDDVKAPLAFRRAQTAILSEKPTRDELNQVLKAVRSASQRNQEVPVFTNESDAPPGGSSRQLWLVYAGLFLVASVAVGWSWQQLRNSSPEVISPKQLPTPVIAVLPFANIGNDPDQVFFSNGIAEDLLNLLANSSNLTVRPRSSSFAPSISQLDLQSLAERLEVTHVLEGSAQLDGDRVRVSARLVDVDSNQPVWSDRYDRNLTNIFEVQDEITGLILEALDAEFTEAPRERILTSDEAYIALLRGRHHMDRWEFATAVEWLTKATDLDEANADTWADLARSLIIGVNEGQLPGSQETSLRALQSLERALTIDPAHPSALATEATYTFFRQRDYQTAISRLTALVKKYPNNEPALFTLTVTLCAIGREDLCLLAARRTVEIAPAARAPMYSEIAYLIAAGRVNEARLALRAHEQMGYQAPNQEAELAILDGDIERVRALVDSAPRLLTYRAWLQALILYLEKNYVDAAEIASRLQNDPVEARTYWQKFRIALIQRDFDAALGHFADALDAGESYPFLRAGNHHYVWTKVFHEFYEDPRYEELLAVYGLDSNSTARIPVPQLPF
jgi:TolB-like protein/Flp pilus assembly protein TadD